MRIFSAIVIDFDEKNDLALLRVDHDKTFPYVAPIAPRGLELESFDPVWIVGAPFGLGPLPTHGEFHYTRKPSGGVEDAFFMTSTPVGSGNSGGALYYCTGDEYFRCALIGVVKAGVGGATPGFFTTHITISSTTAQVYAFLERNYLGFIIPPAISSEESRPALE